MSDSAPEPEHDHCSLTLPHGMRAGAVVDPRLGVYGVGRLRVADASVMASIIAGNANSPSIGIGGQAATMKLENAKAA
jgi:choline dehydrogenase